MTEIFLIRHTQAEGNLYRMMQGHWDGDITPMGSRQIDALAERFRNVPVDAVYSSDLYRARMTAGAITRYHNLPLNTSKELREVNVGPWETAFFGNVMHEFPEQAENFMAHPDKWRIDGAETYAQVQKRAFAELSAIAQRHDGQSVAVVSHGVTIRCILAAVMDTGLDRLGEVPIVNNTSVTVLRYENGVFTPVVINDYSHLESIKSPEWKRNTALRDEAIDPKEQKEYYCGCYADAWRAAHGCLTGFSADGYILSAEEHWLYDSSSVLKMLDGDEPVGLIDMDVQRGAKDGTGWISLLYLNGNYRGKGYGIQLLARAIKKYTNLGRTELRLHVAEENAAAIKFYKNNGFEVIAEDEGVLGMQYLMRRKLGGRKYV